MLVQTPLIFLEGLGLIQRNVVGRAQDPSPTRQANSQWSERPAYYTQQ